MEILYTGFKYKQIMRKLLRWVTSKAQGKSNRWFCIVGIEKLDSQTEVFKTIWKRGLCSSFLFSLHLRIPSGRSARLLGDCYWIYFASHDMLNIIIYMQIGT